MLFPQQSGSSDEFAKFGCQIRWGQETVVTKQFSGFPVQFLKFISRRPALTTWWPKTGHASAPRPPGPVTEMVCSVSFRRWNVGIDSIVVNVNIRWNRSSNSELLTRHHAPRFGCPIEAPHNYLSAYAGKPWAKFPWPVGSKNN
jgi:hypothetical protein